MIDSESNLPANERAAAELQALLNAAIAAVLIIDEQGLIVEFNPGAERLFGYDHDEVFGQSVNMLMPEPYRSSHDNYMMRYMSSGDARIIGKGRELQARKKSGEVFPVSLSVGEARYGDQCRFVGIMRDLSAERAAEQQRHELETRLAHVGRFSLMGEMAAGIAHEINQPLSAIATYSQAAKRMLEAGGSDQEVLVKALNGVAEQVHRAARVIENLRHFIRKQEVAKQTLDLNETIKGVMSLVEADAKRAGINVSVEYARRLPRIEGNEVQLQQVLLNLTRNAVDAMHDSLNKHKGIQIKTERNGDEEVRFSVSDRGPGVSSQLMEGIFHPFVSTKTDGLGVGLAISQTIVQTHAGQLTYANNPEGGAMFFVSLPIRKENERE